MDWLLGPWAMLASAGLWLLQAGAYAYKRDWGHFTMAIFYAGATCGLVWNWFHPPPQ